MPATKNKALSVPTNDAAIDVRYHVYNEEPLATVMIRPQGMPEHDRPVSVNPTSALNAAEQAQLKAIMRKLYDAALVGEGYA